MSRLGEEWAGHWFQFLWLREELKNSYVNFCCLFALFQPIVLASERSIAQLLDWFHLCCLKLPNL